MTIASSHGEFCPTPYFVPTMNGDRNSRYCFPFDDEARDLEITRYGDWRLSVERIDGRTCSREVVNVTLYYNSVQRIERTDFVVVELGVCVVHCGLDVWLVMQAAIVPLFGGSAEWIDLKSGCDLKSDLKSG
jgi:hypothetical protein